MRSKHRDIIFLLHINVSYNANDSYYYLPTSSKVTRSFQVLELTSLLFYSFFLLLIRATKVWKENMRESMKSEVKVWKRFFVSTSTRQPTHIRRHQKQNETSVQLFPPFKWTFFGWKLKSENHQVQCINEKHSSKKKNQVFEQWITS